LRRSNRSVLWVRIFVLLLGPRGSAVAGSHKTVQSYQTPFYKKENSRVGVVIYLGVS